MTTETSEAPIAAVVNGTPEQQKNHDEIRQILRQAINASPLLEGIFDDWVSYTHSGINE